MLNTKRLEFEYKERKKIQKSLNRDKLRPIQNMLKKKKFIIKKSDEKLHSLPIVDETPSGKTESIKQAR